MSNIDTSDGGVLTVPFSRTNEILRILKGRVLTTVDASVPSSAQNKAIKDVIRWAFDSAWVDLLNESPLPEGQSWAANVELDPNG